jgi:uncharacterized membrane protein
MTSTLLTILLWFCALGCGLLAGLYFAFSAVIMTALDRAGPAHGIAAMNSINLTILRSMFMPLFFGTTLGAAGLVQAGLMGQGTRADICMVAGGLLYVLGMFVVTMTANVPLNNRLAMANAASGQAMVTWQNYLTAWTRWNHVRTLASLGASAAFVAALVLRGGA